MSILTAWLGGLQGIVRAGNDLDRLKFLPQKVEDGELINFDGKSLCGKVDALESKSFEIYPLDKVVDAKRCTAALIANYFDALDDKLLSILKTSASKASTKKVKEQDLLLESLLDFAETGDKKGARNVLKDLKAKWFALDPELVDDAIEDIKDAIADLNIEEVTKIYNEMNNTGEEEPQETKVDVIETSKTIEELLIELAEKEDDEDLNSLLLDIADAIKDDDKEDVKDLLLPDLLKIDKKHPAVDLIQSYLGNTPTTPSNDEAVEQDDDMSDEEWIEAWKEDIDAAIEDNDIDAAKKLLEEFKEEFSDEEPEYIEYLEKITPKPQTTTRRLRRGRN